MYVVMGNPYIPVGLAGEFRWSCATPDVKASISGSSSIISLCRLVSTHSCHCNFRRGSSTEIRRGRNACPQSPCKSPIRMAWERNREPPCKAQSCSQTPHSSFGIHVPQSPPSRSTMPGYHRGVSSKGGPFEPRNWSHKALPPPLGSPPEALSDSSCQFLAPSKHGQIYIGDGPTMTFGSTVANGFGPFLGGGT